MIISVHDFYFTNNTIFAFSGLSGTHVKLLCLALKSAWAQSCSDIRDVLKARSTSSISDAAAAESGDASESHVRNRNDYLELGAMFTVPHVSASLSPARSQFLRERWIVDDVIMDALTVCKMPYFGICYLLSHLLRLVNKEFLPEATMRQHSEVIIHHARSFHDQILSLPPGVVFDEFLRPNLNPTASLGYGEADWTGFLSRSMESLLGSADPIFLDVDKKTGQWSARPIGPTDVAQSDAAYGRFSDSQRAQLARVSAQLMFPRLTVLDLSNNGIGVSGLLSIADLIMVR